MANNCFHIVRLFVLFFFFFLETKIGVFRVILHLDREPIPGQTQLKAPYPILCEGSNPH